MRAAHLAALTLICLHVLLTTSCRTTGGVSTTKLIGGTLATESDFPATVFVHASDTFSNGGCTATKITNRLFITAAHCILDSQTHGQRPGFAPHSPQLFAVQPALSVDLASPLTTPLRVTRTYVHPIYLQTCRNDTSDHCGATIGRSPYPPDVGIFEVDQDTPHIPAAPLEFEPAAVATKTAMVGYGCEQGTQVPMISTLLRKRFANVETVPQSALDHPGASANIEDPALLVQSYLLTPGFQHGGASLCFGDSGGSLYRTDRTPPTLIGINSSYSFRNDDPVGISETNWHTRLDTDSRHQVSQWIDSVLNGNEPATATSAQRLLVDDSSSIIQLSPDFEDPILSLELKSKRAIEISAIVTPSTTNPLQPAPPLGQVTFHVTQDISATDFPPLGANEPSAHESLSHAHYLLPAGSYRVRVSQQPSLQPVVASLLARHDPPVEIKGPLATLTVDGPAVTNKITNINSTVVYRVDFPASGVYAFHMPPNPNLRILFFAGEQWQNPFTVRSFDASGTFTATFNSGKIDVGIAYDGPSLTPIVPFELDLKKP